MNAFRGPTVVDIDDFAEQLDELREAAHDCDELDDWDVERVLDAQRKAAERRAKDDTEGSQ